MTDHHHWYVSPSNGDDKNDGMSARSPFKTFSRASKAMRDTAFGGSVTIHLLSDGTPDDPIDSVLTHKGSLTVTGDFGAHATNPDFKSIESITQIWPTWKAWKN